MGGSLWILRKGEGEGEGTGWLYKVVSGEPDWEYMSGGGGAPDERFCGRSQPAAILYIREEDLKLMNGINPYRHRYLYASGDFPCRVQRLVVVAGDLLVPLTGCFRFMAGTR